jgi:sugar-specific transcriptional regulator TrmB
MLETLTAIGFKETDAQVYVFLTKRVFQKATDIANALNLYEGQLYRSLKKLQAMGVINTSSEKPTRFSAVPFERVLDLLMRVSKERQEALQESKQELLSTWEAITKKDGMHTS